MEKPSVITARRLRLNPQCVDLHQGSLATYLPHRQGSIDHRSAGVNLRVGGGATDETSILLDAKKWFISAPVLVSALSRNAPIDRLFQSFMIGHEKGHGLFLHQSSQPHAPSVPGDNGLILRNALPMIFKGANGDTSPLPVFKELKAVPPGLNHYQYMGHYRPCESNSMSLKEWLALSSEVGDYTNQGIQLIRRCTPLIGENHPIKGFCVLRSK